jgi:hypothetical protein
MRTIIAFVVLGLVVPTAVVLAQPDKVPPPGGGSAMGSGSAAAEPPAPPPAPPPADEARSPAELRKICAAAMNADKSFAEAIVKTADENAAKLRLELDHQQHVTAAAAISKNERHVIIAYASMWLVAAGFLLFLWRRQQSLKSEILRLRRDLDAATKDGK